MLVMLTVIALTTADSHSTRGRDRSDAPDGEARALAAPLPVDHLADHRRVTASVSFVAPLPEPPTDRDELTLPPPGPDGARRVPYRAPPLKPAPDSLQTDASKAEVLVPRGVKCDPGSGVSPGGQCVPRVKGAGPSPHAPPASLIPCPAGQSATPDGRCRLESDTTGGLD